MISARQAINGITELYNNMISSARVKDARTYAYFGTEEWPIPDSVFEAKLKEAILDHIKMNKPWLSEEDYKTVQQEANKLAEHGISEYKGQTTTNPTQDPTQTNPEQSSSGQTPSNQTPSQTSSSTAVKQKKLKLSVTGKKVVNLINQTVNDIYSDAISRQYDQWFPNQDRTRPIETTILYNAMAKEAGIIVKQVDSALTQDDKEIINEYVSELLKEITNNYSKLVDNNGQHFGFTGNMAYDSDPYTQQVGIQRVGNRTYPVYASFIDGKRMGKNISGYAGTNNTYSMCDIVCTIDIRSNTGEHVVAVLGKLQTLSYSIYQQKQPVRCLGNMNAKDYVYGQRTIAGSLVFAVFNKHWLVDIYEQLIDKGMMKNWHYIADEIPPFDITVSFANEYGYDSKMALYGVRLMTEGQVMSINDIYIENTYQFVATDIEYMDALNAWEQNNKYGRRFKTTIASGNIASNRAKLQAAAVERAKQAALKGKTVEQKEDNSQNVKKETTSPVSGNDLLNNETLLNHSADKIKNTPKADALAELYQEYQKRVEQAEQLLQDAKIAANGDEDEIALAEELYEAEMEKLAEQYAWEYEQIEKQYPETVNGVKSNIGIGKKEDNAENSLRILKGDPIIDPDDPGNIPMSPMQEEGNEKALKKAYEFKDSLEGINNRLNTTNEQIDQTKEQNKANIADEAIYDLQETIVDYHTLVNQQGENTVDDNVKNLYGQIEEIVNGPEENAEKLRAIKEGPWNNFKSVVSEEQIQSDQIAQNLSYVNDYLDDIYDRLDTEDTNADIQKQQARQNAISESIDSAISTVSSYKDDVIQWFQNNNNNTSEEDNNIPEEEIVLPKTKTWFDNLNETVTNYNIAGKAEEAYEKGKQFFTEKTQQDIDRIFTTEDTEGFSIGTYTPETLTGQTEKGLLDTLKVKYDLAKKDIADGALASVAISNPTLSLAVGSYLAAKQNLLDKCFDNESSSIEQWISERTKSPFTTSNTSEEEFESDTDFTHNIPIPSISINNELGKQITNSYLTNTDQDEIVNTLTDDLKAKRQEISIDNIFDNSVINSAKAEYQKLSTDFKEVENAIREKIGLQQRSEVTDLYDQYENDIAQHYQTIDPTDPDNQKAYSPAIKMVNNMRELMEPNYNIPVNPTGTAKGAGKGGFNKPQRFSLDGGDTLGWGYGEMKTTCITSCAIACPGTFLNPNGYDYITDTDVAQNAAKAAGAYVRYGEGNKYTWESVSQEQLNQMYRPQPGDVVIVSTRDWEDGGHAMMVMEDGQHLIHTGSGISSYIDENGKFVDALDIIKRNETYKKEHNGQDSREFIDNLRRTGVDPHLTVDMLMTYKTGKSKDFEKEGDRYLIACLQTSKYTDNVNMNQDSQLTDLRRLKVSVKR